MKKIYVLPESGNISQLCRMIENAVNTLLPLKDMYHFSEENEYHERSMTIVLGGLGVPTIVTVAHDDSNRITVTTTVHGFSPNPHALTDPPMPYLCDCFGMTFFEKRVSEVVFQDVEKYIESLKKPCLNRRLKTEIRKSEEVGEI